MKKRVFGLLSALFLFWLGLSGCQSCSCGKEAADEQAGARPQGEAAQPQPGQKDQRVSLESYSGPGESGAASQPKKPDTQALDLSGAPVFEPVEKDPRVKAPPATLRITRALKRMADEQARRKGVKPEKTAPAVPMADDHQPGRTKKGKGKLVRGRPQGARNALPQKKPERGRKAGTPH